MKKVSMNGNEEHSANTIDDFDDMKESVCSILDLEEECKDHEKKRIFEKFLEDKMDMLMDKLSDFYTLRLFTFMDCLAEFSKITTDYENEYVQKTINLMYKDYCELITSRGMKELYTNKVYMVSMMILPQGEKNESICQMEYEEYGESAYEFIIQALAHFSGYGPENAIWKEIMMTSIPVTNKHGLS